MKHSYSLRPKANPKQIEKALDAVTHPPKRSVVALPGAEVVDHFPSGQPKTYRYRGRELNRRQYQALIREMRVLGLITAKPPKAKKEPRRGGDAHRQQAAGGAVPAGASA